GWAKFSAEIVPPIGLWGHGASRGPKITAGKEAGKRLLRSMSRSLQGGQACTKNSHLLRRNSGGRNHHEGAAGGRRSFRPPDASLEPQNEGIHFRGTQRHPYHRPAENPENVPRSQPLRQRHLRAG